MTTNPTAALREALEKLALENGPIVIDHYGDSLAWRPLDYGSWTPLTTPTQDSGGSGERRALPVEAKHLAGCNFTHAPTWLCECPRPIFATITPQGGSGELLREALDDLQQAEAEYRLMHDRHGGDARATGRAWDLMRRAGNKARTILSTPDTPPAEADPGTPAYEAARERLVAALLVIGADDDRNGFTALGKRVSAGEAVDIPSWVAMQLMAQPTPDTGGEHIAGAGE